MHPGRRPVGHEGSENTLPTPEPYCHHRPSIFFCGARGGYCVDAAKGPTSRWNRGGLKMTRFLRRHDKGLPATYQRYC